MGRIPLLSVIVALGLLAGIVSSAGADPTRTLFCGAHGALDSASRTMIVQALADVATPDVGTELAPDWTAFATVDSEDDALDRCAQAALARGIEFALVLWTTVAADGVEVRFAGVDAGRATEPARDVVRLPPQRLVLADLRARAESMLGRLPGILLIRPSPTGASVAVDGRPTQAVDDEGQVAVILTPGTHYVEASAIGHRPFSGEVTVRPGVRAVATLTLPALSPAPAAAVATPPPVEVPLPPAQPSIGSTSAAPNVPAVVTTPAADGVAPPVAPPRPAERPAPPEPDARSAALPPAAVPPDAGVSQWWFWSTLAAGVGLAIGGGLALDVMLDRFVELDRLRVTCFDEGGTGRPFDFTACSASRDVDREGRRYGAVASALFGAAGIAVGAAIALAFMTDWGGDDDEDGVDVALTPLVGETGGGLTGAVLQLTLGL